MYDINPQIYSDLITPESLNEGERWYPQARAIAEYMSRSYDVTLNQSAGIIAAYSTNRQWGVNVRTAESRLAGRPSHYLFIDNKCDDILLTDDVEEIMQILHGDKISRFFHNILYPESSPYVTIDRHMIRPYGIDRDKLPYKYGHPLTVYERLERSIQIIGDSLGVPYPAVQASLWISIRGTGD